MITPLNQLPEAIARVMKAGLCPLIHGSPGTSKSAQVKQVAEKYKLKLIDVRLAQMDSVDLSGLPFKNGNKADFLPSNLFPIEGDEIPEGYNGWLVFLDEITSAPKSIQVASYKIILDRMVGNHNMHKNIWMCAAGNLITDNAVVHKMSTALQSRLVHFEVQMTAPQWLTWAHDNEIDHRIIDFITFRPDLLNSFNPKHSDKTFANARTWEFSSKLVLAKTTLDDLDLCILAGTISEAVAREFFSFTSIYHKLPSFKNLMLKPDTIELPSEPADIYALIGMMANNTCDNTIAKIVTILTRLPVEFAISCLIPMLKKNPQFNSVPEVAKYKQDNIHALIT